MTQAERSDPAPAKADMPLVNALLVRSAQGDDLSEQSVDWLATIKRANDAFVTPALWGELAASNARSQLPADLVDYLTMVATENAARNERARAQCLEIGARLADHGLGAVLLKGAGWQFGKGGVGWRENGKRPRSLERVHQTRRAERSREGRELTAGNRGIDDVRRLGGGYWR